MDGDSRDSNRQSTLEEEAKKSNTDCVYFLASPLTCIKGADCEYRHSENARMNPRDCWFWLNGNCLNPKCAFRHPPLDGCRGASGGASSGTFQPSLPPAVPAQLPQYASAAFHPQSYASSRQKVPCYYFQKGNCLKGDKCPFMHGPQSPNEPALPQAANATPVSDPQAIKKVANGSVDLSFTQKNLPQNNSVSPGTTSQTVKADTKFGLLPSIRNTVQKKKAPTNGDVELTGSTHTVSMGRALSRAPLHSLAQDDQPQNGKEVDECLGESPPGFDVLVTDGEEEEEYFDEDSEIAPGHGGVHLSSMRDFDHVGSYTLDEFEGEEGGAYDAYGHTREQFGWDQHHSSPERLPERMPVTKRRLMLREESPDQRGGQDLRQRLSKRRRASGSGGAVPSPNRHADFYRRDGRLREDQYHKHSQEELQHPNTESSSKRLRGRIKFPGRPSPDTLSNPYSDFETERRRMRGRLSRSVPGVHQGKHHEKATGTMNEDVNFQGKRFKGRNARSQERKTESLDFAGPKRLVELKSAKVSEIHEEQNSASANSQAPKSQVAHREEREDMRLGKSSNQDSNGLFSFEGPKPLSDLLKRKREMGLANNTDSKKRDEFTQGNRNIDVIDSHRIVPRRTEPKKDFNEGSHSPISGGTNQGPDSADKAHPFQSGESPVETGYNVQEGALMLDPENPGIENRESEDEWIGGEENQDMEEEYLDDEDGDDFARKLGVMFT